MNKIIDSKKLYIFDQDGTIYLGGIVFPAAVKFINHLRDSGKRVMFFTNNASHNPEFYLKKLTKLGFSPDRSEILTAGDVTVEFLLRHHAGKRVYLVGTPELEDQFRSAGVNLVSDDDTCADVVVTSFDTTLTYKKLEVACNFIRNGAEYLCTHPDYNCPTETGFIPDSGAIAALVTASTKVEPTYLGKPYATTIDMIAEVTGLSREDMCIFGDRLYTDIALGKRHGVTSVLVLSGETKIADVEAAAEADKPDFVYDDLGAVMNDR